MVVTAAAYAVALQKAWPKFRSEWLDAVRPNRPLPTALHPARIICAAPEGYWANWQLADRELTALKRLRAAFTARGLPSAFVELREAEGRYTATLRGEVSS